MSRRPNYAARRFLVFVIAVVVILGLLWGLWALEEFHPLHDGLRGVYHFLQHVSMHFGIGG